MDVFDFSPFPSLPGLVEKKKKSFRINLSSFHPFDCLILPFILISYLSLLTVIKAVIFLFLKYEIVCILAKCSHILNTIFQAS